MSNRTGTREFALYDMERAAFGHFAKQLIGLADEQLEDCLRQQRQVGGRLGEILRARGLLSCEQVRQILSLQARWVSDALKAKGVPCPLPYPAFFSLCLPAYNEEANIAETLDAACAILPEFVQRFEVVVVNDGSRDQTDQVVARYAQREPRVRLVQHEHNQGYGAAVGSGLRAAQGDLVAFTDSDGQFSFLDLPRLLIQIGSCDVVAGYRYPRADPWYRCSNAWAWNQLIRILFGVRVRDLDCAFKLFRREVIGRLDFTASGAAINAEILAQCVRDQVKIREVPVGHYPRYHGAPTGARFKVILRAFRELPQLWKYRKSPTAALNHLSHSPATYAGVSETSTYSPA